MNNCIKWITLFGLFFLTGSCTPESRVVNFDLNAPLRVAILPFEDSSSGDSFLSKPFASGVNYLPLIGKELDDLPATLMREKFSANLKSSNLDPILNSYVDQALIENNLYNLQALKNVNVQSLEDMLNVDAVIFGEVTNWDRTYLAIESSVTIGLKVKMVDVSNGETLWEHHYVETERRGLSKGPTGYVSAGLEPLRGLSNELFFELSDNVSRRVVDSIRPEKQGEFTKVTLPSITHGTFQYDSNKREILVLAIGEAGHKAFFTVGKREEQIKMSEVAPGQYSGRYQFPAQQNYQNESILIRLVNQQSQRTTLLITSDQKLSSELDPSEVAFLLTQKKH